MTELAEDNYMLEVKRLYPEFTEEGWHVEKAGIELDELNDPDVGSRAREIERELFENGQVLFVEDAIDQAVQELVTKIRPPKGCIFVRLIKENETPVLVIIQTPKQGDEL
jgi:hypothetical protein